MTVNHAHSGEGPIEPAEDAPERPTPSDLTHFDDSGRARMVDVGAKPETQRLAMASGEIRMRPETRRIIREGRASKGDVLAVAQVAAIMGTKRTPDLVPMCHPLLLTRISVDFAFPDGMDRDGNEAIRLSATVGNRGQTGVEIEALTAVSVGLLTIYDMVKAIDRGMVIGDVRLDEKHGGRSGDWSRDEVASPGKPGQ